MKIVKYMVAACVAVQVGFASDSMIVEMKNMRDSMHQINDGFFYNQKGEILEGLTKLKKSNAIFGSQADVKKHLPKKVQHMSGISYNTVKRVNSYIDEMKVYIDNNQFGKAANSYTNILNSCTSCHAIVRGW